MRSQWHDIGTIARLNLDPAEVEKSEREDRLIAFWREQVEAMRAQSNQAASP